MNEYIVKINEHGQILLPQEVGELLKLEKGNWIKIGDVSPMIVLIPEKDDLFDEFTESLIHEGIIIETI